MVGQKVYEVPFLNPTTAHFVDITSEAKGVYFVTIQSEKNTIVKRIILR
jgi:hypothetical protein